MKSSAIAACVLLLSSGGQALAQGARVAADTPQARCAAANRQSVAELAQALEAARNRNRLNPVTMSRLLAFEAQLGALRAALPRDGRNLKDCEQLSQTIAAEQERLQRLAGPDPQLAECMAANQAAHGQVQQALAALPEAARVAAPARQARLLDLGASLAREGQTLQDCREAAAAIAQERVQIQALTAAAATPAPDGAAVDACRATNIDAYGEALRAWRDWASILGVSAGAAEYDAAMLRLRRLRDQVARPGGSLADCETLARAIAQERAQAPRGQGGAADGAPAGALPVAAVTVRPARRPAAAPPAAASAAPAAAAPAASPAAASAATPAAAAAASAVREADCREPHSRRYNGIVERFTRALQATPLAEPVRQQLQALGERLTALHRSLAPGAAALDCAAVAQSLARAETELGQIPAGGTPAAAAPSASDARPLPRAAP